MIDVSSITLLTAFGAGVISFLSPCVLPLVPGYISYVAGDAVLLEQSVQRPAQRLATVGLSASFVAGFSTVFVALGAGATLVGQLLLQFKNEAGIAGGIVVLIFGLFTVGMVKLPWLQRDLRMHAPIAGSRPLGAYLIGLAFAFGWTPCIGPVLGTILTVTAVATTVTNGVVLLGAYSLGLGVPFLITAAFTGALLARLHLARKAGRRMQFAAGIGMIVMGVAMITGMITKMALWLLDTFPAFASMG